MAQHTLDRDTLKQTGLMVSLFLVTLLIRFPFFNVPMISDEGGYAYVAYFWGKNFQPYVDIPFDRLQGIFIIYKLIFILIGESIFAIRFAASLYTAATAWIIFIFSKHLFSSIAAGLVSAMTFIVFVTAPGIEGFTANGELFAILPLTWAAFLTWKQNWFWAGVLSGIALTIKPIGISGYILAFLWLFSDRKSRDFIRLSLGFVIAPLLCVLHGYLIDWQAFRYSFIENRLVSASPITFSLEDQFASLSTSVVQVLPVILPLMTITLIVLINRPKKEQLFFLSWFVSSIIGMSIGGNWFQHYFVQLIPLLTITCGRILLFKNHQFVKAYYSLLIFSSIFFLFSEIPYWFYEPKKISKNLYGRMAYLYSEQAGEYVRQNTEPDEKIFVAFSEAQIYFYAKRQASIPVFYHLQLISYRYWYDAIVEQISAGIPSMVVYCRPPPEIYATWHEFRSILLDSGYVPVKQFGHQITVYSKEPVEPSLAMD